MVAPETQGISCMKSEQHIVYGGGWHGQPVAGKPRALMMTFLSVIWCGIIFAASVPSWQDFPPRFSDMIPIIVPGTPFIAFTIFLWFKEKSQPIGWRKKNPNYDPRKLY